MRCNRRFAPGRPRRGAVIILMAVLMVPLAGIMALALDSGLLMTERRHIQATADASALAAGDMLFRNYTVSKGLDPNGQAKQAALGSARGNGYTNDGINSVVTVNVPPLSGKFVAKPGYAEVIVESRLPRRFSGIWGSDRLVIRSRAVAVGRWEFYKTGIIVLDPLQSGALNAGGGGNVELTGGARVIVNSNHASAAVVNGQGSIIASEFDITGGYTTPGGGQLVGRVNTGVEPTPDPLAYLPQPDRTGLTVQSSRNLQIVNGNRTLKPGVYTGGISIGGQATVTLEPGIYYIDGGGFSFTGQGSMIGPGVMIFNAPKTSNDKISLAGSPTSTVSITPPSSGIYQGLSFFQDRASSVPMNIGGNGQFDVTGTFYAAGAELAVSGNSPGNVIGSQYISRLLKTSGTAGLRIDWSPDESTRLRTLHLVE